MAGGGIRSGMGITSLILLAGAVVLLFFVVLSGVTNTTPLNKTYFLSADTSTIAGSGRATSQWTYFYVCGAGNADCGKPVPALPFGYAWVGGSAGAPDALVGKHAKHTTSTYYYYMWRFGWVFYLIALVSTVSAFFLALLSPISRLASGLAGLTATFALFWMSLAAALMTVVFVKARDRFHDAGMSAKVGRYAFGFTWGAWAAILLAALMLFLGAGLGGSSRKEKRSSSASRVPKESAASGGGFGFYRRQRHRGAVGRTSSISDSQRRVKDEYA